MSSLGCVRCAEEALARGEDSPTLRLLAGANLPDGDANNPPIDADLAALFAERGVRLPTHEESLAEHEREIAARIVDGSLSPRAGVERLYQLYVASGCADALQIWNYLDDQVSLALQGIFDIADVEAEILERARSLVAPPSPSTT
jgi:hypothetical protein